MSGTQAIRERFAKEHGVPLDKLALLAQVTRQAFEANEHECNGDPHPEAKDRHDKNECAKLWGEALDSYTRQITELVATYGLRVEFTGLRPCLRDAAGHYIEIPH